MATAELMRMLIHDWRSFVPGRPSHQPQPARYPGGPKPEGLKPRPYINPDTVPKDWHDVRGKPMKPPKVTPYTNPIITLIGTYVVLSEAIDYLGEAVNPVDMPTTADFERDLRTWIENNPLGAANEPSYDTTEVPVAEIVGDQGVILDLLDFYAAEVMDVTPPTGPNPFDRIALLTNSSIAAMTQNLLNGDNGLEWPAIQPSFGVPKITITGDKIQTSITSEGSKIELVTQKVVEKPGVSQIVEVPRPEIPIPEEGPSLQEIHQDGIDALKDASLLAPLEMPFYSEDAIASINQQIGQIEGNLSSYTVGIRQEIEQRLYQHLINNPQITRSIQEKVNELIKGKIDTAPEVEPQLAPETQISVKPEVKNVPQIRVQIRTRHQSRVAESTLQQDRKTKSQLMYLSVLNFVNKTWGPISEFKDFLDIVIDNMYIQGRKARNMDMDEIIDALLEGDVYIDADQMLVDLVIESLLDTYIAALSQFEKRVLLDALPPSHPLINMYGNPSTWARRLGYDLWSVSETNKAIHALKGV